jgi:hypothetical protein
MPRLPAAAAPSMMVVGLVAFAIFPACGGGAAILQPTSPPSVVNATCPGATSMPPVTHAFIGPDVVARAFCAGIVQVPIASIDELGTGVTTWSFAVTGDAAFSPGPVQVASANTKVSPIVSPSSGTFATCQTNSPEVAFVDFAPPAAALPGSTFDAIATVHSEDGSFADGTVKLHGEIVAPDVSVSETNVDFGDVAPGDALLSVALDFGFEGGSLALVPDSYSNPPFSFMPLGSDSNTSFWDVILQTSAPGDFSATVGWRAVPSSLPTTTTGPCVWMAAISLHARVGGDGSADADTADATDGGADLGLDAP